MDTPAPPPNEANPSSARESNPTSQEATTPSHIVGIGASAGGLEALQKFFGAMPEDSGMAFVIIQHLSPHFKSMMDELLGRHTQMTIIVVQDSVQIKSNHIYLLPPGYDMILKEDVLSVRGKVPGAQLQTPISDFFSELGRQVGERSVGIILSGTGSDGSGGVRSIWESGGLILAQDEESAKFESMPNHAVATGLAHAVLPPQELPQELLRLTRYRDDYEPLGGVEGRNACERTPFQLYHQILSRLDRAFDLNFAQYKSETIRRRIERRVAVTDAESLEAYVNRLEEDDDEVRALYDDLLIGVTQFMRDPEAYAIIRDRVVPRTLAQLGNRDEIRIWVAGCATGEEAYSLAILFLEGMQAANCSAKLRIFATDRHRESLRIGAAGVYSDDQLVMIDPELREKYFIKDNIDHNRVIPLLRKSLIFSSHNILKDPPFTNVDLVSCRNVLIYFRPQAQRRVLGVLYFALRTHGHMFLGSSESNKDFEREFRALSSRWKIYEKITSYRLSSHFGPPHLATSEQRQDAPPQSRAREPWLGRAYSELLKRYIPTGALITDQRKVLHLFGEAQNYLRPPEGRMTQDIVDMATGNLKLAMSSVIQRVIRSDESVDLRSVEVQDVKGKQRIVDVRAEPLHDTVSKINLYLVVLLNERTPQSHIIPVLDHTPDGHIHTAQHHGQVRTFDAGEDTHEHINMLESELSHARQSLQSAVEELETSNEELQSSNEELLASNEELQSTNEELHSVNEELYSVNAEHEEKIHELHKVTGDLRNLMQATDVGLVFTDNKLRIRLFTPKASEILNILPQDVGRELDHLTSKVKMDEFSDDIRRALKENCSIDARVALDDGRVFLRRITPYVDMDHEPAGLILTFVEITALHQAQVRQAESELRFRLATQASGVGIWEWHKSSETIRWDDRMFELYGVTPKNRSGILAPQDWEDRVLPHDWKKIQAALDAPQLQHDSFEITIFRGKARQERVVRVDLTSRPGAQNGEAWLVGTHFDVTEERQFQARLQEDEARYRSITEHSPHGIASLDGQGKIRQVNSEFARIFGATADRFVGQSISRFFTPPSQASKDTGIRSQDCTVGYRCDGSRFPLDLQSAEVKVQGQTMTLLFVNDLTEQQQSARRRQLLAAIVENTDDAIFSTSLDGVVLSWNQGAERIYGYSSQEMLGKNLSSLVLPNAQDEHRSLVELMAKGCVVRNRELQRLRKNNSIVDIAVTMSPMFGEQGSIIGISCTERDISEQKQQDAERQRIEAKMIEAAKLESLGVLAGGIAHDFNNLLSGILGSTSVVEGILETQPANDTLQRNLNIIRNASTRAAELCQQLLAYSGRGRFLIERIDLSRLVRETSSLISSSISKQLEVHFDLSQDLPMVAMDATQVRQVVMNLVINASESMGNSPGKISVKTGVTTLDGTELSRQDSIFRTELGPGTYVTLRVEDAGCGIETETIERVFEPFFTTKFTGRGLGLSAVLGIARGHQGGLWVDSQPGRGTAFTLFLRAQDQPVVHEQVKQTPRTFQGQGDVLIVDDEILLRESLAFMLDSIGFTVHQASDGIEALEKIAEGAQDFKMVFLDLTMPRLNGPQTLKELRRTGNSVPVLLMSGYHRSEATAAIDDAEISGFIPKPFDRGALVSALHRAFENQDAPRSPAPS